MRWESFFINLIWQNNQHWFFAHYNCRIDWTLSLHKDWGPSLTSWKFQTRGVPFSNALLSWGLSWLCIHWSFSGIYPSLYTWNNCVTVAPKSPSKLSCRQGPSKENGKREGEKRRKMKKPESRRSEQRKKRKETFRQLLWRRGNSIFSYATCSFLSQTRLKSCTKKSPARTRIRTQMPIICT